MCKEISIKSKSIILMLYMSFFLNYYHINVEVRLTVWLVELEMILLSI